MGSNLDFSLENRDNNFAIRETSKSIDREIIVTRNQFSIAMDVASRPKQKNFALYNKIISQTKSLA